MRPSSSIALQRRCQQRAVNVRKQRGHSHRRTASAAISATVLLKLQQMQQSLEETRREHVRLYSEKQQWLTDRQQLNQLVLKQRNHIAYLERRLEQSQRDRQSYSAQAETTMEALRMTQAALRAEQQQLQQRRHSFYVLDKTGSSNSNSSSTKSNRRASNVGRHHNWEQAQARALEERELRRRSMHTERSSDHAGEDSNDMPDSQRSSAIPSGIQWISCQDHASTADDNNDQRMEEEEEEECRLVDVSSTDVDHVLPPATNATPPSPPMSIAQLPPSPPDLPSTTTRSASADKLTGPESDVEVEEDGSLSAHAMLPPPPPRHRQYRPLHKPGPRRVTLDPHQLDPLNQRSAQHNATTYNNSNSNGLFQRERELHSSTTSIRPRLHHANKPTAAAAVSTVTPQIGDRRASLDSATLRRRARSTTTGRAGSNSSSSEDTATSPGHFWHDEKQHRRFAHLLD